MNPKKLYALKVKLAALPKGAKRDALEKLIAKETKSK